MSAPQYPSSPPPVMVHVHGGRESQALPALANLLCCPGLGQLIQGRLLAAIVWYCLAIVAGLSLFACIGVVLVPLVWFAAAYEAAVWDSRAAAARGFQPISSLLGLAIGGTALLVFAGMASLIGLAILGSSGSTGSPNAMPAVASAVEDGPVEDEPPASEPEIEPALDDPGIAKPVDSAAMPQGPMNATAEEPETAEGDVVGESNEPSVADLPQENDIAPPETFGRVWIDKTGKHRIRAEYVEFRVQGGRVVLRKEDGSTIDVAMRDLSDADQDWIREENRRRARAGN